MPLRLGLLLYPAIAYLAMRARKSPPDVLWRIGAVSAQTAVRPAGVGIGDFQLLNDYVKQGLIIRSPEGLYHVDAARYRRRRARTWVVLGLVGLGIALFGWLMLR